MTRERSDPHPLPIRALERFEQVRPFPPVPPTLWRWVVVAQILLLAAALILEPARIELLTASLVLLIVTSAWRFFQHDVPRGTVVIFFFCLSTFAIAGGDLLEATTAQAAQFPTNADLLKLAGFGLFFVAAVGASWLRGPHDRASTIDGIIYAVSLGTPLWAFWVEPELGNPGGGEAAVFALMYVVVLWSGGRLVLTGGVWTLPIIAATAGGTFALISDFLARGPIDADGPAWAVAALALLLFTITALHPTTAGIFRRGIRPEGMAINTRLGLLACAATVPMAVLASGFIRGEQIQWGIYASVFMITAIAVAIRVEMTRRAGHAIWRPGALAAGATLVLFAVTGLLAALGQSAELRRTQAASFDDVVIAVQPLDGLMARGLAGEGGVTPGGWVDQVADARLALATVTQDEATRKIAAPIAVDLDLYARAAAREWSRASGAAATDTETKATTSTAAYRQLVGDAEQAAARWQQAASDRAQLARTVTVVVSAATVLLIALLLLTYGALQRRAEFAARDAIDQLTGLGSRSALLLHLRQRLDDQIALARGEDVAIVSVDIVDGRRFRDSLGDAAYQDLLRGVADRLLTVVRDDDIVSRPRNDGFAVALASRAVEAEATVVAQRIVGAFLEPVIVEQQSHTVTISIGIAFATDVPGDDPVMRAANLLRNGDLAAGDGGRSEQGIRVFAPAMEEAARERIELAAELRRGMESGELRLFYQPLIDLNTGLPSGYEALMRWQHPTRGLVSPGVFIPLAERAGLISELGGWALMEACRQVAEWQAQWGDARYISVNVAAAQLQDGKLLQQVHDALDSSGLAPSQLQLEVTESSLMEDLDAADKVMRQVQLLGVRWALDDFGTGYSSLSYLRRFPVQVLKIDKSFIDDITDDDIGGPLVAGIIDMARNLRLTVVAEGIEDADQGMRVRAMGGDAGQGYLFSRPLPPEQVLEFGRSAALPGPRPGQISGHLRIAN